MKSNSLQQNILLENLFQSQQDFLTILRSSESLPFLSSYFLSCSILSSFLFFFSLLFSSLLSSSLHFFPSSLLFFTSVVHFLAKYRDSLVSINWLTDRIVALMAFDWLTTWRNDCLTLKTQWLIDWFTLACCSVGDCSQLLFFRSLFRLRWEWISNRHKFDCYYVGMST